ncbi:Rieske [2Fe-2S] domain protein [Marinobacter litoralis]|uniref:Rieske [2Fe-2S] domain protein n=1 Tax=Marinobacter litoralis TaxID=187981 RepID=A0A3M2RB58_9GAMM|nr:Rieske 2Fe-2S domain-containing protein [Marinobacter litoralis]RMJ02517.1 Rieske [2Fe-2S] domain protein [Marinobacter litoralis]
MQSIQSQWQTACPAHDLVPGKFVEFRLKEKAVEPEGMPLTGFVFLDNGTPRAYLNVCPHLGIELNWMPGRFMDADNLFIQCSTHGALFKPGTGECIAGPCQGDALTELDVREREGLIEVRLQD